MAIEVVFIFFFRILGDREAKKLLKQNWQLHVYISLLNHKYRCLNRTDPDTKVLKASIRRYCVFKSVSICQIAYVTV